MRTAHGLLWATVLPESFKVCLMFFPSVRVVLQCFGNEYILSEIKYAYRHLKIYDLV